MLQFERSDAHEVDLDTIQTAGEQQSLKTSMLYHVLPAVVQSRMPSLPSIRQSISDLRRTQEPHSKSNSVTEISLPRTPPPEYMSRPGSGSTTPYRHSGTAFDFDDDVSVASSTSSLPTLLNTYETATGISWQHARHGVVAMEQAHRQASIPPDDDMMATIIRSQYVHSMTLFLRSLPPTLTSAELMSLREAIPPSILNAHGDAPLAMIPTQTEAVTQVKSEKTLLWRTTAWLVFKLFLLIQLMLPYIKLLLRHAARFESEHQITRRVISTGVAVGSGFSRECWRVSRAVCQMNDGMLGDVVSDALVYCAEGIGGGIQQGLAEARSQHVMKRRRREEIACK